MRSRVPSPFKFLRLLIFVVAFGLLLQFSISYARLLHQLGSPSSKATLTPTTSTLRRILDRLRIKQQEEAEAEKILAKTAEKHSTHKNGLLETNPAAEHPIYQLISESKKKWEEKLAKASRSLPQAVRQYKRRYGRTPPAGFDRWWKYASQHEVQLPDEYDQIPSDLEPFWGMRPSLLRRLREEIAKKGGFYTITCRSHVCTAKLNEEGLDEEALRNGKMRMAAQLDLVKPVEHLLPDVAVTFYAHDVPWQFVGHDMKSTLEDMVALGEFFDDAAAAELDTARTGWEYACSPTRPLRTDYDPSVLPSLESFWESPVRTLVASHKDAMDPCLHPSLIHTQGFLLAFGKGPRPVKELFPALSMCKTTLHADVLAVANENWSEDVGEDPPWNEKKDQVLWRGSNTGIWASEKLHWNMSQRMSLIEHVARTDGSLPVLSPNAPGAPVGEPEQQSYASVNRLVDIGFVSPAIQCDPPLCKLLEENYLFKDRMNPKHLARYKYLLDVDGNGWSARFKQLMSSRSAVMKATIFPEWYTDRVQEWVHYIPLKADLSDLYDVTTFFLAPAGEDNEKRDSDEYEDEAGLGGAGGVVRRAAIKERRKAAADRDALGREIGEAGRTWSRTFWRKEDMVAYQFRLFLELARLFSADRDSANYLEPMSDSEGDFI